uniref:Coat protein n=1 Tax=Diaporthe alternavirus 1 TaxID=2973080 RepID=A0A9C7CAB3_9VIRU|nr:coat protein [Diaporthe alternavirus 1]
MKMATDDIPDDQKLLPGEGMPEIGMLSMEEVLAMLRAPAKLPEMSTEKAEVAKEDRIDELSLDGVNDERYGNGGTRVVRDSTAQQVQPADAANVTHVPVSAPRQVQPFNTEVKVLQNTAFSDKSQRDLANLVRGGGQDYRAEGDFSSMVLSILGHDNANAVEAPLMGLLTRIAQLEVLQRSGATAALAPNVAGWDVRTASLDAAASARKRYPGYAAFFIPHSMTAGAASALISILLPGGAGAYGWRFRPRDGADDPRHDYMPSASRWLYPGGNTRVLAVFERPPANLVYGGFSFTKANVDSLVGWARGIFGNMYYDQAVKSVVAASYVYVEPEVVAENLGENFAPVGATTVHQTNDLNGAAFGWDRGGPPPGIGLLSYPDVDTNKRPPGFDRALWDAARATQQAPPGGGDPLPAAFGTLRVYEDRSEVVCTWRGPAGVQMTGWAPLADCLVWLGDAANGVDGVFRTFADSWHAQVVSGYLGGRYDDAHRDDSDVELAGFRNSFGYSDTATMGLPRFSVAAIAPLVAGIHEIVAVPPADTTFTDDNWRAKTRHYVSKLHVAHVFTCAERHVWPDGLDTWPFDHRAVVASMPKKLQPLAYLVNAHRGQLAASNWQILEAVHRFKGTGKSTAYYSYDVRGEWRPDKYGVVHVNEATTAIAALDAAVRLTWNLNGTLDADGVARDAFSPVRDLNGLYAPLAFAPIARRNRRLGGVRLAAGVGMDALGKGANTTYDTVNAY